MKYEFHPEAELELYEAALRYESEVPELGHRFGGEVERVVQLLLQHPDMGSPVDKELRHFVLRKGSDLLPAERKVCSSLTQANTMIFALES